MPRKRVYTIRSKRQLAALASGVRQEIIDVLPQSGPMSVAELALFVGRAPDSLYYHLRILESVGLVKKSPGHTGRYDSRFESVGEDMRIDTDFARRNADQALPTIIGSMLRLTNRDYRKAFSDARVTISGPRQELTARRKTLWLTPDELERLNTSLTHRRSSVPRRTPSGKLYALTIVLAPIAAGNRSRPRKDRRK